MGVKPRGRGIFEDSLLSRNPVHLLIRRAVWIWIRGEEFSRTLAAAAGAGELLLRLGVCPHHCVGRRRRGAGGGRSFRGFGGRFDPK
uniref:Uncharacterized protein n=1 Tax=Oryza meridionalis TaxID=40149 RepID=A0A0E0DK10_9ORYZ